MEKNSSKLPFLIRYSFDVICSAVPYCPALHIKDDCKVCLLLDVQLSILLSSPLTDWINNVDKVRKESKVLLDHFLAKGQTPGTGNAPFWTRKVVVESLSESRTVLSKNGYRRSKVCLEDLVPWQALVRQPWAKGPPRDQLNLDMGWKQYLVVVYEVLLQHLGLSSSSHYSKRNSSLDFVSPSTLHQPVEKLRQEPFERVILKRKRTNPPKAPLNKALRFSDSDSDEIFTQTNVSGPSCVSASRFAQDLPAQGIFTQPLDQPDLVDRHLPPATSEIKLVPVLSDWEKFGDMFNTLSEWKSDCLLQVLQVPMGTNGSKFLLHDSETSVLASFNAKYTTSDLKFLSPGAIIQVWSSSGCYDGLVIVSLFCSYLIATCWSFDDD